MKILLACPGFENPTCGIGNYSKQFAEALGTLGQQVICYGGPLIGLYDRMLEFQPEVVHIQFEYGWASPERLAIISRQCAQLKIKLVVTMHSVGPTVAHNWVLANEDCAVVVHQEIQRQFFLKNATHIPLAIPYVEASPAAITIPRVEGVARVGWFGNCFYHKGLHDLLDGLKDATTVELLVLGGKPTHSVSYYDRCREIAKEAIAKVYWYNAYLPDSHVVAHLKSCDAIIFPYSEYGATGCSAALRLALNAERLCCVTNSSHFADVLFLKKQVVATYPLPPCLSKPGSSEVKGIIKEANKLRQAWSFLSIVSQHIEKVYGPGR